MVGRFSRRRVSILLIIIGLVFNENRLNANGSENEKQQNAEVSHEKKSFKPGEMIIEHVSDAYFWHIITFKDKVIALPLPVILYSKQSGFHFFSSESH